MDAREHAASLLMSRQPGFSLPQAFYKDSAVFGLELETLFYAEWLFAGHSCEIPKTGDYFSYRVGDCEAVVLRDAAGGVRAFHNACRHRGSRICQGARGNVPKLVCPYHQWTYELDGRLLFAREMGPGFDPSRYPLKPVHCAELAGYIFICFAPQAPDFAAFHAQAEPYLAPHRLEDAKVALETSIVEKGNWKLVWENNRECYHCSGSHPELCRTFPDTPTFTGIGGAEKTPEIEAHWSRCESAGLPSRFALSADGQHRTMRIPLLRAAESFTMDGKAAVAKPLGGVATPSPGSMLLFHYPSTWNHVLRDHAISFRVTPLGPQETQVTTKWLVHKDAVEGVDYDLARLSEVWTATNDEDRRLVEQNQLGVNSPAYEPGPYAAEHENGVEQFVAWYCAALGRHLSPGGLGVAAE